MTTHATQPKPLSKSALVRDWWLSYKLYKKKDSSNLLPTALRWGTGFNFCLIAALVASRLEHVHLLEISFALAALLWVMMGLRWSAFLLFSILCASFVPHGAQLEAELMVFTLLLWGIIVGCIIVAVYGFRRKFDHATI